MSKSANSNLVLPVAGGVALLLGVGYGVATTGYGNDRIEALEAQVAAERLRASEAVTNAETQAGALEAQLAEMSAAQAAADDQVAAAEREMAELRAALLDARSQPMGEDGADKLAEDDVVLAATSNPEPMTGQGFGIGRAATDAEIAAWDVDVLPDGRGLPEGSGDVWTGDEVFAEKCASCHGDFAEGRDNWPVLAGGFDTLDDEDPVKTVGSYWPYLSTVWDYVHRSMPFGYAGTLTDDETYAIVAYILYSNDLVDDDFTLSNETFADVEMPNAGGFMVDDRADTEYALWSGEPCMENCKDGPAEVTRRSSDVGVTPADDGSMAESVMEAELARLGGTEWGAERLAGSVFMIEGAEEAPMDDAALESPDPQMASQEAAKDNASNGDTAGEEVAMAETSDADSAPADTAPDPALVAEGETVFRQCSSCHQVGDNARNRSGPQLNGVHGRVAGAVDGFRYSNAFQDANAEGLVWDDETLAGFLADPRGYIDGTKMTYRGLRDEADIAAVIAYLRSFE